MKRPLLILGLMIVWSLTSQTYYGTASYYTRESAQREGTSGVYTANGEVYNQHDFTCAMRTRDFNHLWRVCNRDNHRCVDVRNNDFGPNEKLYQQGRIIDLSEGAFQEIADLDTGVIHVSVQKIR